MPTAMPLTMPTTGSTPNQEHSTPSQDHGGPKTEHGKAIASRNATTHGLFARDIVLPALGEDPEGYRQVQDEWTQQLASRNLLEQHYVEKIAAASWRLRRLHRWQAQLFEDATLTEDERLDRLDKVLRHETALQRQIDTAVKMLAKEVPQLYKQRLREQVLEDLHITERECRDEPETDLGVSLETSNRLYRLRKATHQAVNELSVAPLDTPAPDPPPADACSSPDSLPFPNRGGSEERTGGVLNAGGVLNTEKCQNELAAVPKRTYRTMLRQQETCVSGRTDDLRARLTPEQIAQIVADDLAWGQPPTQRPFSQPRALRVASAEAVLLSVLAQ